MYSFNLLFIYIHTIYSFSWLFQMLDLLTRLRSIERLSMQSCMLKFKDCLRAAEAIKLSRTLRRWSMIDNVMFKLHYIRDFLVLCSKVPTLREVG